MKSDLPDRSFKFAVSIVNLSKELQKNSDVSYPVVRQLLKAGTSVGANIEEGQGSQSESDFLTKYSIACKECREANYWLRLIKETEDKIPENLESILSESNELVSILTTIIKKLKGKRKV